MHCLLGKCSHCLLPVLLFCLHPLSFPIEAPINAEAGFSKVTATRPGAGKCKAIGVSNFSIAHLESLRKTAR